MPGSGKLGVQVSLTVNGAVLAGLLQAQVLSTRCYSADTFSVTVALGATPLSDLTYWATYDTGIVALAAASTDGTEQPLIVGAIDTVQADPIQGVVVLEGRDLSARLIDSYTQQNFVNQTASEVVTTIALNQGLIPVVTATSGLVGRYYGDGYTRLSLGQFSRLRSDWDLVVDLARQNQFDAFVSGTSLFFQPASISGSLLIVDVSDVTAMRIERNLGMVAGPAALVQSWNSQDMAAYTNQGSNPVLSSGTQSFLFNASNLTSAQVDESAAQLQNELQRLQTILQFDMPWDPSFEPGQTIVVTGTASPLDAGYVIDRVDRTFSLHGGASQRVRAVAMPGLGMTDD